MKDNQEALRYERKFLVTGFSTKEVEQLIKFHPACFTEIYHTRRVNNIYFDSLGLGNYYDNQDGVTHREKIRIRWYGETFGQVKQPILEYKIKKGLLGNKRSFELNDFKLDKEFSRSTIQEMILSSDVNQQVKDQLLSLQPLLLNSYVRTYFLSADKNFRLTIDRDMAFYLIRLNQNTFMNNYVDHHATVVELKYDSVFEEEANSVASRFEFALTKSSKYSQGLEHIII